SLSAFGRDTRANSGIFLRRKQLGVTFAQLACRGAYSVACAGSFTVGGGKCRLRLAARRLDRSQLAFQRLQTIALLQADRRLTRCIGRSRVAVPTPQIAALRNQALTRFQLALKALAFVEVDQSGQ